MDLVYLLAVAACAAAIYLLIAACSRVGGSQ